MRPPLVLTVAGLMAAGCAGASTAPGAWQPFASPRDQERPPYATTPLIVASFDQPGHVTNAGTPFGGWDKDPGDQTQFCRVRLVDQERVGSQGYSVMLEYDVESPNPAFNGFWMKLPNVRTRMYEALSVSLKGDSEKGFTRRLWIELKGNSHTARFLLEGITPEWQRVRIPLAAFDGIRNIREAIEVVIVFEDETVTEPVGVIYLDDVAFDPST